MSFENESGRHESLPRELSGTARARLAADLPVSGRLARTCTGTVRQRLPSRHGGHRTPGLSGPPAAEALTNNAWRSILVASGTLSHATRSYAMTHTVASIRALIDAATITNQAAVTRAITDGA